MSDAPLKRCPKCRHKVRRLLGTGAGIIFKGSGFYETDYRSSDYKEAAKKDTASTSDSGEKSDKKTGKDKNTSGTSNKKKAKKE